MPSCWRRPCRKAFTASRDKAGIESNGGFRDIPLFYKFPSHSFWRSRHFDNESVYILNLVYLKWGGFIMKLAGQIKPIRYLKAHDVKSL